MSAFAMIAGAVALAALGGAALFTIRHGRRAIAVYAGSFDPVTEGHLGVVREAARLHRHVVVLVAVNPAKEYLFSPEERVELLRAEVATLANVSVDQTSRLVVEHARKVGATVLVRGIRGATDAEAETALANQNRLLAPEITTIFLPTNEELSDVSSSRLKSLARRGADLGRFCSPRVAAALRTKLGAVRRAA